MHRTTTTTKKTKKKKRRRMKNTDGLMKEVFEGFHVVFECCPKERLYEPIRNAYLCHIVMLVVPKGRGARTFGLDSSKVQQMASLANQHTVQCNHTAKGPH